MKKIILSAACAVSFLFSIAAFAETKIKMYFNNEDITKVIEVYSKASGQKFIIDPSVRGKISIFIQEDIGLEEAFNHLSSSLAINGFAISKQGDTMIVKSGRNIQRDYIETTTKLPSLKPERMATWIYTFKNTSAENVNRDLRILPSKDGEMSVYADNNQIIISDWTSNLNRIADVLKEIDVKASPETAKIVEAAKKERMERRKHQAKVDGEIPEMMPSGPMKKMNGKDKTTTIENAK